MIKKLSKVKNKYNLKPSDVKKFVVVNHDAIKDKPFWRNNVVKAYCLSGCIADEKDYEFGAEAEWWIGFYDDGHIDYMLTLDGGMVTYDIKEFYNIDNIDNLYDRNLQIEFLTALNWLLDSGICIKS